MQMTVQAMPTGSRSICGIIQNYACVKIKNARSDLVQRDTGAAAAPVSPGLRPFTFPHLTRGYADGSPWTPRAGISLGAPPRALRPCRPTALDAATKGHLGQAASQGFPWILSSLPVRGYADGRLWAAQHVLHASTSRLPARPTAFDAAICRTI